VLDREKSTRFHSPIHGVLSRLQFPAVLPQHLHYLRMLHISMLTNADKGSHLLLRPRAELWIHEDLAWSLALNAWNIYFGERMCAAPSADGLLDNTHLPLLFPSQL